MGNLSRPNQLVTLIGQRLQSLARGDLLIDNEPNVDDLGPLELVFDSGTTLQLRLGSDGESIEVRLSPDRPLELLGQGGTWPRVDLSAAPQYEQILGLGLVAIDAIYFGSHPRTDYPETLAGLTLSFDSGQSLTYYNAGDFAKIYVNEMPPALATPFYLRVDRSLAGT